MFGGKKRTAVKAAVSGIQPLLRTLEMRGDGELPKDFWSDPYVLGFLTGCIMPFATIATNGRLGGQEIGEVGVRVYAELAPEHDETIWDAMLAFKGSSDYQLGMTNADKCLTVACGVPGHEDDPDVLEAKATAAQLAPSLTSVLGPSSPEAATAGALMSMLFYDVVRKRLS